MADPLSLTASVIGILGVSAQVVKATRDIVHHDRKAPSELLELSNELVDINLILSQIEPICLHLQDPSLQSIDDDTSLALSTIIIKSRQVFGKVNQLLQNVVKNNGHINKVNWIRSRQNSRYLRSVIRDLRLSLMQVLSLYTQQQTIVLRDHVRALPNCTWPRFANSDIDKAHTPLTHNALQQFVDSFEPDLPNPLQDNASISSSYSQSESSQSRLASSMTSLESDGNTDSSAINQFALDNLNQQLILSLKEQLRIHDLNFPITSNLSRVVRNIEQIRRIPKDHDLFYYAQAGNTDGVRSLFTQRLVSPTDQTGSGATALHLAFASRQVIVCKFLLDAGADPLLEDDFKRTPLEYAAYSALVKLSIQLSVPVASISRIVRSINGGDKSSTTECLIIKDSMIELEELAHKVGDNDKVAMLSHMVGNAFLEAACEIELEHARQETYRSIIEYIKNTWLLEPLLRNLTTFTYTTTTDGENEWLFRLDGGIKCWFSGILSTLSRCGFLLFEALFELYGTLEIFHSLQDHALQCERPLREGFKRLRWDCNCGMKLYDDFQGTTQSLDLLQNALDKECEARTEDSENRGTHELDQESSDMESHQSSGENVGSQSQSYEHSEREGSDSDTSSSEARSSETSVFSTTTTEHPSPIAVYPCFSFGPYGRAVKYVPVKRRSTDEEFIKTLAHEYYESSTSVWFTRYFSLWEVRHIRCVKFRLTDRELVDIQEFDKWPGEADRSHWEYQPFPATHTPLISSVYIMHLWQNPYHMNKSEFWRQNTKFQRFIRPFRGRGPPSGKDQTRSIMATVKRLCQDNIVKPFPRVLPSTLLCAYLPFLQNIVHRHGDSRPDSASPPLSADQSSRTTTPDPESASTQTFKSRSLWFFNTTPKKLKGELMPCFNDDFRPPVGWGLYFQEEFSTPPAFFWLLMIHMLTSVTFLLTAGMRAPANGVTNAMLGMPALILAATVFAYTMVQKNCECASKSRVS